MRWHRGTSDADIEDRRGSSGGGFRGLPGGGLRIGLGGLILLGILSLVFKQDFFALLDTVPTDTSMTQAAPSGRRSMPPPKRPSAMSS